jgi:hypothetical protein
MEEKRNACKVLVGRLEGNLEDYYRLRLREIRWKHLDCIYLVQDREKWRAIVNAVMNFRAPIKCGEILD